MIVVIPVSIEQKKRTALRVPIRSGRNYCVESPQDNALVMPELAEELERVLDLFAGEVKDTRRSQVGIFFKPGIFGHHKVGRAADIYGVGGLGLDRWKRLWDVTQQRCFRLTDENQRWAILREEKQRNLGWRLYKALQDYGRWSKPEGYPIQLFGPWTRSEGPLKSISDFLLHAHRDHIHVAK